ncbi:hypothetical protein Smp_174660 [Schistosoma mansoni]|uniref:DNA-directed RNA polymerase I subunit RPA43 n=1 Tax=Schistosoma mansoni TaxID=6183 RepID=G4VR08_SCHMA|nr:hypothetical protein Smp_174660 [Schistosoma mansoni]|eukprot:XP_018655232.1 hypothetical protein Smp_174660 [Schistosoma mansoni]
MESAAWSFCVPIYPNNFTQLTRSLLQYVISCVNKFIPDLEGVLVDFDAKSLQIITEVDYSDRYVPNGFTCGLFLIHPELNHLRVHGKIKVNVFRPHLGLEVDAIVSVVRPQFILCRTEISNVMISIPRLSSESVKKEEFSQYMLKPFDKIRVKLTQIDNNFGSPVLQGDFMECLSKPLSKYSEKQYKHQTNPSATGLNDIKPVFKVSDDTNSCKITPSFHENSSDPVTSLTNSPNHKTPKVRKRKIRKLESLEEVGVLGNCSESLLTHDESPTCSVKKLRKENSSTSKILKKKGNLDSEETVHTLLSDALLKCGRKYKSNHNLLSSVTVKEEPT